MPVSVCSGVEAAVLEEQERRGQEVTEMERLLNVARREHAKAVVQLQQVLKAMSVTCTCTCIYCYLRLLVMVCVRDTMSRVG